MLHDEFDMSISYKLSLVCNTLRESFKHNWYYALLAIIIFFFILKIELKVQKRRKASHEYHDATRQNKSK